MLDRHGAITPLPPNRRAPLDGHECNHRIVARRRVLRRSLPLFCGRIVPTATGSDLIGEIRCQRAERVVWALQLLVPLTVTVVGMILGSEVVIGGAVFTLWVWAWLRIETRRSTEDWGFLRTTLEHAFEPLVVTEDGWLAVRNAGSTLSTEEVLALRDADRDRHGNGERWGSEP